MLLPCRIDPVRYGLIKRKMRRKGQSTGALGKVVVTNDFVLMQLEGDLEEGDRGRITFEAEREGVPTTGDADARHGDGSESGSAPRLLSPEF